MNKNRGRRPTTYLQAHNKAVRLYQKSSIFLLWSGILNIFAIIIGIVQAATYKVNASNIIEKLDYIWPKSGYALSYSLQQLINNALLRANLGIAVNFLIILIGLIFSGAFAAIGFLASRGKKWLLLLGSGLYALDFALMFFLYALGIIPFVWTNYAFTLVSHVLILIACIVAIVEYYNVIHIEMVFKGNKDLKLKEEIESEVIACGKENNK